MKAITSVKLSSTNRFALIGYGVRSNGIVEGHDNPLAACEIMALQRPRSVALLTAPMASDRGDCKKPEALGTIATVGVINDIEDEVNIAHFHPIPGQGLVYGTKKGKVRVYCAESGALY